MSMWETPETPETPAGPAGGDDIALTTPVSAALPGPGVAAGDTCPTCGGAPGPGKIGRCVACVEEEWAKLRAEMGGGMVSQTPLRGRRLMERTGDYIRACPGYGEPDYRRRIEVYERPGLTLVKETTPALKTHAGGFDVAPTE